MELAREHTHAHEVQRALTSSQVLGIKHVSWLLDAFRASKQAPYCFFTAGRVSVVELLFHYYWTWFDGLNNSICQLDVFRWSNKRFVLFTVGRGSEEQLLFFFCWTCRETPKLRIVGCRDVIRGFK